MGRKTKKEKMASQLRRLRQSSGTESDVSSGQEPVAVSSPTINLKNIAIAKTASPSPKIESSRYDYTYIFKDLRKTGILMVATILFEVAVNLTMRTSFAKLILRTFGVEI